MTSLKSFLENTQIADDFRKKIKSGKYEVELMKDENDEFISIYIYDFSKGIPATDYSFIYDIEEKEYSATTSKRVLPDNLDQLISIEF